jgi:predicted permease
MTGLKQDIRYALQTFARTPGLALVIILSLALGIGANTAIFSLIRVVMLRSLPVRQPDRLVLLHWHGDRWPKGLNQSGAGGPRAYKSASRSLPYPFFRQLRTQTDSFESVFAFAPLGLFDRQNTTVTVDGATERVDGEMVSGEFFSGLGVPPAAGRLLSLGDELGGAHVAVISHAYWTRRFGADLSVLGRSITINRLPFVVIGVASPRFTGIQPGRTPDVWVPMLPEPELTPWGYRPPDTQSLLDVRGYWWAQVIARMKDGVDERLAVGKSDVLFQQFVRDALPQVDAANPPHIGFEPGARGLDLLRRQYEEPLMLLMAMVALVLVIACANVAVLLLSRAMGRRREFGVRLSLGAPRARLVRQLFTENLLLAAVGGALGLASAEWTSRALLLLVPAERRPLIDTHVDVPTLLFAAVVSIATALLFGLAPAILGTRVDLLSAIKQSGTGAASSGRPANRAWSSAFLVVQIALCLVLVTGAALLLRTLSNLHSVPLGVDDRHLLVFGVDASQNGYTGDRLLAYYEELLRRLSGIPGAQGVTAARLRLFSGWVSNGAIRIAGMEPKAGSMMLNYNAVGPDFAKVTGLRVIAGRDLTWGDVMGKRRVALVNEEMARYFFGDVNVLGRRYTQGAIYNATKDYEIVGVVSNAKYSGVRGDFPRTAYIPFTAYDSQLRGMFFEIKTMGDPLTLAAPAREVVRSLDSSISAAQLDSMANQIDESLWQERLFAKLATAFGLLALTLAVIGLYGTMAYDAGRRCSEIALRMALGARYSQVLWMILRQALVVAAIGIAGGLVLSLWSARFIASLLFGLTPRDPVTFAIAAATLLFVVLLAAYGPARRAALVDPAAALKQE